MIRIDKIYGNPQYIMEILDILQYIKIPCVIISWGNVENETSSIYPFVIDMQHNDFTLEIFKDIISKFQIKADNEKINTVYFKIFVNNQPIDLKIYKGLNYDYDSLLTVKKS